MGMCGFLFESSFRFSPSPSHLVLGELTACDRNAAKDRIGGWVLVFPLCSGRGLWGPIAEGAQWTRVRAKVSQDLEQERVCLRLVLLRMLALPW